MWYYNNDGQDIFERCFTGIWFVLKLLFKILIYSPLVFASYMITIQLLEKNDHAVLWIGLVFIFSVFLYLLLYFLKGIIIGFKSAGNFLWLTLFIICTVFTCVLPVWICFETIKTITETLSKNAGEKLTWIFSVAIGLFIYSRYHFLTNIAPASAFPFYQAGIDLAFFLLKLSWRLKAIKSKQLF
jgi:hypothetical protein